MFCFDTLPPICGQICAATCKDPAVGFGNIGFISAKGLQVPAEAVAELAMRLRLPAADVNVSWTLRGSESRHALALFQSTISTTHEDDLIPDSELTSVGSARVVADARLDNRSALAAALELSSLHEVSDESLILRAYHRWGTQCGSHLRGDFAFIIWDDARDLVLACRDPFGVRSLAYARDDDRLVIASTIAGVRSVLRIRPRPNGDYLRKFLDGSADVMPGSTAYDSIFWVPPGHQITSHAGPSFTLARYDEVRPSRLGARPPADVFGEFRSLLTTAVERRLRAKGPVAFTVSGGFDSSSVLCLASAAVEAGRSDVELRSYSAVFHRYKEADERSYLAAVLASCPQVTAAVLPWDDERWSLARFDASDGFPLEDPPRGARFLEVPLARLALHDGCRVVLRGAWADQLLLSGAYEQGQLLWDLPLRTMAREARHFWKDLPAASLLRSAVPGAALRVRRLGARLGLSPPPERAPARMLRRRFVHGRDAGLLAHANRTARWLGIEYRMPFLDRDLHEFVMSLPAEYFFEDGKWKRFLREGLRDVLPAAYQDRRHVAYLSRFVLAGMQADRDAIAGYLASPMVVDMGLRSAAEVSDLVSGLSAVPASSQLGPLHRLLAVEIWLRHHAS